jgi:hypothetical protein
MVSIAGEVDPAYRARMTARALIWGYNQALAT